MSRIAADNVLDELGAVDTENLKPKKIVPVRLMPPMPTQLPDYLGPNKYIQELHLKKLKEAGIAPPPVDTPAEPEPEPVVSRLFRYQHISFRGVVPWQGGIMIVALSSFNRVCLPYTLESSRRPRVPL